MSRADHLVPAFESARAAWPGVTLDFGVFVDHVMRHAGAEMSPKALARLHLTDLYLAAACLHGDRPALKWFDQQFMAEVAQYIARLDKSRTIAQEVQQVLRVKLLVSDAGRPAALAGYSGRGALGGWVRVAAIRATTDLLRAQRGHIDVDDAPVLVSDHDPELSALQRRYTPEFNRAISAALRELPATDRNMLRWHYLDGLGTDAIGKLLHLDGSTVRRRLTALRRRLLEHVRTRLTAELGIGASELDSLMALVRSRLDVTITARLRRAR